MARVSFAGVVKQVCLAYTPDAQMGDYVLVHAGFALSVVSHSQARDIMTELGADI